MKMTDDELQARIGAEVETARVWRDSTLANEQERNLRYYLGLPIGNEVEGRSQVVSWDVFETIESALPDFLEPFFSGDSVGEFEPVGVEDEQAAEQATDYVNHIITKRNPAFEIFSAWFKDALVAKIGVVRVCWDETRKETRKRYEGLTDDQVTMLLADGMSEVVSHDSRPDGSVPAPDAMMGMTPPMIHDVEIVRRGRPRGVKIENVPPWRFLVSRDACNINDARLIGEIRPYTRSELVEMGYGREEVEGLSSFDPQHLADLDFGQRDFLLDEFAEDGEAENEELDLFYGFLRVDFDGDGVAELRRLFIAGNKILENEEVEDHEYCTLSPIMIPHRVVGLAMADPIASVQEVNTSLNRQYLDSLYLANNPQTYAVEGQVRMEDLLSRRIGGIVRMRQPNMAGPLQTTTVAREALEGIEWGQTLREQRSGVTRYNQGLDADSLNKTATGVSRIMAASQKRLLMILRTFAETGVKELFRKTLGLVTQYQDKADVVRLRNQWVEFDPSSWNAEMDCTINVGIGSGDQIETLQNLQMIGAYMEKAAAAGLPFVQPDNLYEFGKLLIKNAKVRGGEERLLTDPAQVPPRQPQPSPEQTIAQAQVQAEQIKSQTSIQTAQFKAQNDREKLQAEREIKATELQIKDRELAIKEREVLIKENELRIKQADLELKAAVAAEKARTNDARGIDSAGQQGPTGVQ